MTALIDLDPLLHIVANVQYAAGNRDNPTLVATQVANFIDTIKKSCKADDYIMFFQDTGHTNFRKGFLPEYKGHRTPSPGYLLWGKEVRKTLGSKGGTPLYHIESDDAIMAYAMDMYVNDKEYIIVENDKDLKMIPGKHYNPYKAKMENRFYSFTEAESELSLWMQVITGDPTDMPGKFCGIEKVGPKTAEKILRGKTPSLYPAHTFKTYTDKYGFEKGTERMLLTYRMVNLLTKDSEMPSNEVAEEIDKVLNLKPEPIVDVSAGLFEAEEKDGSLI